MKKTSARSVFIALVCVFTLAFAMLPGSAFSEDTDNLQVLFAGTQDTEQNQSNDVQEVSPTPSPSSAAEQTGTTSGESSVVDGENGNSTGMSATDAAAVITTLKAETQSQTSLTPQESNVRFTKLELREGSIDGTLVCDLLTDQTPELVRGQEYYLRVSVEKNAYTDDCWVSLDLPWWTTPNNMLGGDSWTTPGSSVTSTSIDKVVGYQAATGQSMASTTTAGKV